MTATAAPAPLNAWQSTLRKRRALHVVERWNRSLAAGRGALWSPTIKATILVRTPWLDVFCPGCRTSRAIDLRTLDRHPLASLGSLLGLRCSWCLGSAPMPVLMGLYAAPPAAKRRDASGT